MFSINTRLPFSITKHIIVPRTTFATTTTTTSIATTTTTTTAFQYYYNKMATKVIEYGTEIQMGPKVLACQRNPFLKNFTSMVVSCKPWTQPDEKRTGADSKQAKKKDSKNDKFYEIQLEDTILFPEGGGQPTDLGKINDIPVLQVSRTAKGEVLHKVAKPLEVGDGANVVVDWERRWDHMQQHSGQHLISAAAKELFETPTTSWWLSAYPKPSSIDLAGKELTDKDIQRLEQQVNDIIREGREMIVHIFHEEKSIEEFGQKHAKFRQKPLPAGSGPLRVIEITDVEYNTCCGTHLSNTRQMQMIKICNFICSGGNTQIFFLSGQRVLENLQRMFDQEKQITSLLTCSPDEFVSNISKLQTELRKKTSDLRGVEKRLMELETERIMKLLRTNPVLHEHWERGSMQSLQQIADNVISQFSENEKIILLFTTGQIKTQGQFVLVCNDKEILHKHKKELLAKIDGRGGGADKRLQGNANNLKNYGELLQFLSNSLGIVYENKHIPDESTEKKDSETQ